MMENKWIKEYLAIHGVALDQRIERSGGGQYLVKFLEGFSNDVKKKVMNDVKKALKSVSEEFDSNDESWKMNLPLNNVCVKLNNVVEFSRALLILKIHKVKINMRANFQIDELNYLRLSVLGNRDIWDVFSHKRDCIEISIGQLEHLLKKQNGKKS